MADWYSGGYGDPWGPEVYTRAKNTTGRGFTCADNWREEMPVRATQEMVVNVYLKLHELMVEVRASKKDKEIRQAVHDALEAAAINIHAAMDWHDVYAH